MEQNLLEPATHFNFDEDDSFKQKCQPISSQKAVEENDRGSFDCNICLDSADDPVVTQCGHLYCWPCIYKWLHVVTSEDQQEKCCPVCKANISTESLVPLYGRGRSPCNSDDKKTNLDQGIPRRPSPPGVGTSVTTTARTGTHPNQHLHPNYFQPPSQSIHSQQYYSHPYGGYSASLPSNLGGSTMASFINPFGEMVYARIFGNPEDASLFAYPYPFALMGGTAHPRLRRQEVQLEKSLNRVSVFLFFCILLCLILF